VVRSIDEKIRHVLIEETTPALKFPSAGTHTDGTDLGPNTGLQTHDTPLLGTIFLEVLHGIPPLAGKFSLLSLGKSKREATNDLERIFL
jgi:hypothetical protein